jgi:hypothetical protein
MKLIRKTMKKSVITLAILASVYNVSNAQQIVTTGTNVTGGASNTPSNANSFSGVSNNSGGTVATAAPISTGLSNNSGGAVANQGVGTSLVVIPNYDDATLAQAGCDKQVWGKMIADYQTQASLIEKNSSQAITNLAKNAPIPYATCFNTAASIITNATRVKNAILALLHGGGFDSGQLTAYAEKVVVGYACNKIDAYIAQSGLATQISGGINTVGGYLEQGQNTNINVGGVNFGSVGQIATNSGWTSGSTNQIPTTTAGAINGNTSGSSSGNSGSTGVVSFVTGILK